jgi:hypothetical protein
LDGHDRRFIASLRFDFDKGSKPVMLPRYVHLAVAALVSLFAFSCATDSLEKTAVLRPVDTGVQSATQANTGMTGIFGMDFGSIYPADEPCGTNSLFSLVYDYGPDKPFNVFKEYVVFASPVTRTVFQVRGTHTCKTRGAAVAKVAEICPLLEMKYGHKLQYDSGRRIMRFPNGDRIEIDVVPSGSKHSVVIDAISSKYDLQDTEEAISLKQAYAKSLVAYFGKTLDEALPASFARKTNECGEYIAPVPRALSSLGFTAFSLRVLPNGRIGGARATVSGRRSTCNKVFERTKDHLQLVFGPVVKERPYAPRVDFSAPISGARCKFLLEYDAARKNVVLEIGDCGKFSPDDVKDAAHDLGAL